MSHLLVGPKFDAIGYLKTTEGHPSQSLVRSWCRRQAEKDPELLTYTKRGDTGTVIAVTLEKDRDELKRRFEARPRPKNPKKRKTGQPSVKLAGDAFAQAVAAAEDTRAAKVKAANEEYEQKVAELLEQCKQDVVAISSSV
jgi:hypothetical protein